MSVRVRPLALSRASCQNDPVPIDVVRPPAERSPAGLAGLSRHLLCAVPQLVDPNFVRSVVLIIDHSDKGAFGLVINHRLPTTIAEFADAVTLRWEGPADQGLRLGGPVEPVRAFLLHDQSQWDPLAEDVAPGAFLTASLEGVRRVSDNRFGGAGRNYLVFLGYAGWGPGQLESEMAQGSWLAVPLREPASDAPGVPVPWLFDTAPEVMWHDALTTMGIDPARLIGASVGSGRAPQA